MSELVKLMLYQHEAKETIIDSYSAKEWDDFLIIKVEANRPDMLYNLQNKLAEFSGQLNKQIIIVPADVDLDFYGVKVSDD